MKSEIFQNRADAGKKLSEKLVREHEDVSLVVGITGGGTLVGDAIADRLGCGLDIILSGIIPIPFSQGAGLGAVTSDGTLMLNEQMVEDLELSRDETEEAAKSVQREMAAQEALYRDNSPCLEMDGKRVILVDDGIASGYTMLPVIESVRKRGPSEIIVAIPVASNAAVRLLSQKSDSMVALIISQRLPFSTSDFYVDFRPPTVEEIRECLQKHR